MTDERLAEIRVNLQRLPDTIYNTMRDLISEVQRLRAAALLEDWRPISSGELPKIGEHVLISCPSHYRPVQEAMRLIPYEGALEWYWSTPHGSTGPGCIILQENVNAWRPLPAPWPIRPFPLNM